MKPSWTGSRVRLVTPGTLGELWSRDCTISNEQEAKTCVKQCDHAQLGQLEPAVRQWCEGQLKTIEVTSLRTGHNICLHARPGKTRATGVEERRVQGLRLVN